MAFLTFILCLACQGAKITDFGWGTLIFGCLSLYSVIVIHSIYKKFKEEYKMYRSKVDMKYPLLEDIEVDVDSAITFQNRIGWKLTQFIVYFKHKEYNGVIICEVKWITED